MAGPGSRTKDNVEARLAKTYFDVTHPAGFSSITKLAESVNCSYETARKWLAGQDAYTLHRPIKRKFKRNRYIIPTLGWLFEADLADFQKISGENDQYKYLLCVIDGFSKMVAVEPLLDKSGNTVSIALKRALEKLGPTDTLRTDKGKEFLNAKVQTLLKENNISHLVTQNEETKCAMIERFIRTLKERMYRFFTHFGKERYIDNLQEIVASYNNTKHSAIGKKPIEVNSKNTREVWEFLYSGIGRYPKLEMQPVNKKPIFKVGETVKISEYKQHFAKGYRPNWSYEVFKVKKIIKRNPIVYIIEDLEGEEVKGTWYSEELQRVSTDEATTFRIEDILKTRGKGAKKQVFVKWQGYPAKFNSWVYSKDLQDLSKQ
jgi:Integrase core domain